MVFEKYKFTRLTLPWQNGNGNGKKEPKTINIFTGFFFMVNFCVGTGFLGIPYSFFYTGVLPGIPTLLLIGFVSWLNANWLLEVMARAQAIETYDKSQSTATDSDTTDSERDDKTMQQFSLPTKHPKFEITIKRKFEPVELFDIFFNSWMKYFYLIVSTLYVFLALWTFTTVAATAWSINIPLNFGDSHQCIDDAFQHRLLPAGGCLYAYYFSVFLFGIIVVTLSLLDLKEQALVQLFLGILRFVTVGIIVIYAIVKLAEGGEVCDYDAVPVNLNESFHLRNYSIRHTPVKDVVVSFNFGGWLTLIPVVSFAFLLHSGIPSMTHPVKQKKYLHWLLVAMFLTSGLCYMSLGVVAPLWFKDSTQEVVTLNFGQFTGTGNSVQLRILSYYLILFPSLDVMSAYPLNVHVGVNNIYTLLTGRDTSRKPKYKYDFLIRFFLRLIAAILPLLAAFGIANLIYILKYAGLLGFIVCFFFPTALQLRSIYVCMKKFASVHISVSGSHTSEDSLDHKGEIHSPSSGQDKSPLLSMYEATGKDKRSLYMTPYSNVVLSHPVFVVVFGVVGAGLFVLSVVGLFVHPEKVTCFKYETFHSPILES